MVGKYAESVLHTRKMIKQNAEIIYKDETRYRSKSGRI